MNKHKWKYHSWLTVKCSVCGAVADGDDQPHFDKIGCKK